MTVQNVTPVAEYPLTGVSNYSFLYEVLDRRYLVVEYTDSGGTTSIMAVNTDYSVTLNPDFTGYVTILDTALTGSIAIIRSTPQDQDTDWVNNDPLDAEVLETSLDKLTMLIQELEKGGLNVPADFPDGVVFPSPEAEKVIGWNTVGDNLQNWPEYGSFQTLHDDAVAAAAAASTSETNAASSEDLANKWATEAEDVEVVPGYYSSYHWAQKAIFDGIIDLDSTDEEVISFAATLPNKHYYLIPHTNVAGGMVKIDADGTIPISLFGLTTLNILGVYEPQPGPGYENPSELYPSMTFDYGDMYVLTDAGFVNTIDPSTGLPADNAVVIGSYIAYFPAQVAAGLPEGWYVVNSHDIASTILAANVTFDDTSTTIKGATSQLFGQNVDAAIAARLPLAGGVLTGPVTLANGATIAKYTTGYGTFGLIWDDGNIVYIGSDATASSPTSAHKIALTRDGDICIFLEEDTAGGNPVHARYPVPLTLNHDVGIWSLDVAGTANHLLFNYDSSGLHVGSRVPTAPDGVRIVNQGQYEIFLNSVAAQFGNYLAGIHIRLNKGKAVQFTDSNGTNEVDAVTMDTSDNMVLGTQDTGVTGTVKLFSQGVEALELDGYSATEKIPINPRPPKTDLAVSGIYNLTLATERGFTVTTSGSLTFAIPSNPGDGSEAIIRLNKANNAHVISWPGTLNWLGSVLDTSVAGTYIIRLLYQGGSYFADGNRAV